jgi:hypothetical protein
MTDSVFVSACRTIGVISPPGMETATPTSACLCWTIAASVHDTLAVGTSRSASAIALMTISLTETLKAGTSPLSVFFTGAAALISPRSLRSASISQSSVR